MPLSRSVTNLAIDYNLHRNSNLQHSIVYSQTTLCIYVLQCCSLLTLHPDLHNDGFSNAVQTILELFHLTKFLEKIHFPCEILLYGLLLLIGVYLGMNIMYLTLKQYKKQEYSRLLLANINVDAFTFYKEIIFLPIIAVGSAATLNLNMFYSLSTGILTSSSIQRQVNQILGVVLLVMGMIVYMWLLFITSFQCNYNVESANYRAKGMLDLIEALVLLTTNLIAYSSLSKFIPYILLSCCLTIKIASFLWNRRFSNCKMNRIFGLVKAAQLTILSIMLVPRISIALGASQQWSTLACLFYPLLAKTFLNLSNLRFQFILRRLAANQEIARQRPYSSEVDIFLQELYYKFCNLDYDKGEIYDLLVSIIGNCSPQEDLIDIFKSNDNPKISSNNVREALRDRFVDYVSDIYTSYTSLQNSPKSICLDTCYSYITFLKDISQNYGKAFILMTEVRGMLENKILSRDKIQLKLLDHLLQQKITANRPEKSISAHQLFRFLDAHDKVQLAVKSHLIDSFSWLGSIQRQTIILKDIKMKGKKLLADRQSILADLDSQLRINQMHQKTLLLYDFFLKDVCEIKSEGLLFGIQNRINIYDMTSFAKKKEGKWDLTMEFFANHINSGSDYFVLVFSLSPHRLGKILRHSKNLMEKLGITKSESHNVSISSLEPTIFRSENLKFLQQKIFQGQDIFNSIPEGERILYLQSKKGALVAFSFFSSIEVYNEDPCMVCYLQTDKNLDQNFILFDPSTSHGHVLGIGQGLSPLFIESNFNLLQAKSSTIHAFIPSVKEDFLKNPNDHIPLEAAESYLYVPNAAQSTLSSTHEPYLVQYIIEIRQLPGLGEKVAVTHIKDYTKASAITGRGSRFTYSRPKTSTAYQDDHDELKIINMYSDMQSNPNSSGMVEFPFGVVESLSSIHNFKLSLINKRENYIAYGVSPSTEKKASFSAEEGFSYSEMQEKMMTQDLPYSSPSSLKEEAYFNGSELLKYPVMFSEQENQASFVHDDSFKINISNPGSKFIDGYREDNNKNNDQISSNRFQHTFSKVAIENQVKRRNNQVKNLDHKASSIASSVNTNIGFIRSMIIQNKTPGVLMSVYSFGTIVFILMIISTFTAYSILSSRYTAFYSFAKCAGFSSAMKAGVVRLYMATEILQAIKIGSIPNELQMMWRFPAQDVASTGFTIFLDNYQNNIVNFDPQSISNNLDFKRTTMNVTLFGSSLFDREVDFYEANVIFLAYAEKIYKINALIDTIDSELVDFMRGFVLPYCKLLDSITDKLFEGIYDLYEGIFRTLKIIMIANLIVIILGLLLLFIPIFRKFEMLEIKAITKLCEISSSDIEEAVHKIVRAYKEQIGDADGLTNDYHIQSQQLEEGGNRKRMGKSKSGSHRVVKRNFYSNTNSIWQLMVVLLVISAFLSGSFIVIDIIFSRNTQKVDPFIHDIESIAKGLPAYITSFASFMRIFNEIQNPDIIESLPKLMEDYLPVLQGALQNHKNLNTRLRDFDDRILVSNIPSEETKTRYQNTTDERVCQYIKKQLLASCTGLFNGETHLGLPSLTDTMLSVVNSSIDLFLSDPTPTTLQSILLSSDTSNVNIGTYVATTSLTLLSTSEQADVAKYAQELKDQKNNMLILSLIYTLMAMILIWIPTIVYLQRRFRLARNLFLLLPSRLLKLNAGIKQLFNKW